MKNLTASRLACAAMDSLFRHNLFFYDFGSSSTSLCAEILKSNLPQCFLSSIRREIFTESLPLSHSEGETIWYGGSDWSVEKWMPLHYNNKQQQRLSISWFYVFDFRRRLRLRDMPVNLPPRWARLKSSLKAFLIYILIFILFFMKLKQKKQKKNTWVNITQNPGRCVNVLQVMRVETYCGGNFTVCARVMLRTVYSTTEHQNQ